VRIRASKEVTRGNPDFAVLLGFIKEISRKRAVERVEESEEKITL
jgi:hypothetical protein